MKRDDKYEKYKITKVSTDKVVTNVYMDAFHLEKVRFQNVLYKDAKNDIKVYVDFSVIARLAADVTTGRLFKKIEEEKNNPDNKSGKYIINMGGNLEGNDGKPLPRVMDLGISGNTIFVNMQEGPGREGDTGLIIPNGTPTKKISVPMSFEDFREMILYTNEWVRAYLVTMVRKLAMENDAERKERQEQKENKSANN